MEHLDVIVYRKKELVVGLLMKATAVLASIYGMWRSMTGVMSLTYFTNLSNIFMDIVLVLFFVIDFILLASGGEKIYKELAVYCEIHGDDRHYADIFNLSDFTGTNLRVRICQRVSAQWSGQSLRTFYCTGACHIGFPVV